nr:ribosomal protein S16 [Selliguea yakushimensis]
MLQQSKNLLEATWQEATLLTKQLLLIPNLAENRVNAFRSRRLVSTTFIKNSHKEQTQKEQTQSGLHTYVAPLKQVVQSVAVVYDILKERYLNKSELTYNQKLNFRRI